MERYLKNLIEQFKSATGTKNDDVNSQKFISEFSEWVRSRKFMSKDYISFIEYMDTNPTVISKKSIEIGKGKHDTIALDSGIYMITPFSEGINGGVITADFQVYEGTPIMIRCDKDDNQFKKINTEYVRRFLTQNPYHQSCIKNWEQLHNKGENITVGVYGSIYDKDMEQKIKQIKLLSDSLIDDCFEEDYGTKGDIYYYAVSSTRNVKKKILTK